MEPTPSATEKVVQVVDAIVDLAAPGHLDKPLPKSPPGAARLFRTMQLISVANDRAGKVELKHQITMFVYLAALLSMELDDFDTYKKAVTRATVAMLKKDGGDRLGGLGELGELLGFDPDAEESDEEHV